jgi:hypothetical protein
MVRREPQAFVAETQDGLKTSRRSWISEPGGMLFPYPVQKVVGWLKDFKPEQAKPLAITRQSVCPSARQIPIPASIVR